MKTIEIEDDVYEHILHNTTRIGESASEILRRLLKISEPKSEPIPSKRRRKQVQARDDALNLISSTQTELSEYLAHPSFRAQPNVIGKFLFILSYAYRRDSSGFKEVLTLSGRRRKYFGRTSQELDESRSSVHPKKIPGSPYWVVKNNDTPKKRRMLEDVLRLLGYSDAAVEQAIGALG